MIELITLFTNFLYVGAFAFGGGYAMIPMFQRIVEVHDWMTIEQFTDMIAISQMTPGPIAINMATFIGYQTAGVVGSLVATLAVCLPSFVLVTILIRFVLAFDKNRFVTGVLAVLRPVVAGLISAAAFFIAMNSSLIDMEKVKIGDWLGVFDPLSVLLAAAVIGAIIKFKQHPILYIIGAGVVGALWM